MEHTFNFSIRQALRETWVTFQTNAWFFIGIAFVTLLINVVDGKHTPAVLSVILAIASFVWSVVWMKVTLVAARNEQSKLTFDAIKDLLPTWRELLMIIGVAILGGLIVLGGLILLIIPGIYVGLRLAFANLAYLDRKDTVQKSLRYSWNITKGNTWTVLLVAIVAAALYVLGAIALGVGLLVAYPIAGILVAKLYLALSEAYNKHDAVVVQPVEISADLPEVETTA